MPLMLAQPGYFVAISKHFLTPPQKIGLTRNISGVLN
jgi:hypothetical protein